LNGEPDLHPLPFRYRVGTLIPPSNRFQVSLSKLAGSDFPDLPWFFVNLFHRKAERIDRARARRQ
jgi:hypothetical protein